MKIYLKKKLSTSLRGLVRLPLIGTIFTFLLKIFNYLTFRTSINYWENRYLINRNSGEGSYGLLSEFKAEIINKFVYENNISSVIEFGCGDGHQLSLAKYPKYIGLDVSKSAILICKNRFLNDPSKNFFLYDPDCFIDSGGVFLCDLGISLDVIFHLVEDKNFYSHLNHLFSASNKYVIIYSSDFNSPQVEAHVKNRNFSKWIEENISDWKLEQKISNRIPYNEKTLSGSWSEFFIYKRYP